MVKKNISQKHIAYGKCHGLLRSILLRLFCVNIFRKENKGKTKEMPVTSLYKTMLLSISVNIGLLYTLWKSLLLCFGFFWFGEPYLQGGTLSDCAMQKLMLHSLGGIMIWDNDEVSFQVTQGIKS